MPRTTPAPRLAAALCAALCSLAGSGARAAPSDDPLPSLRLSGDMRYRHDWEGGDELDRHRHRLRARVGLTAKLAGDVLAGLRLASGSGDHPGTTNQSFTDGFSSKPIWLDRAWLEWRPAGVEGVFAQGGKMPNPLVRPGGSDLLWDPDLNPEGLALGAGLALGPVSPFFRMAMLWAEERKADDDSWVLAAQTGIDAALLDGALKLTAGAGYFDHRALQGRTPLWKADDGLGNSVEPTDEGGLRYAEDYDVVEGFFRVGGEVLGRPWTLYGDLAWNAAAGDDALGWLGGATVGKCKAPLDVCVRYTYRVLPADAVVAVFTDSDFLGGGTDGRGHKASLSLQLTEQLRACVTGYDNVRVLDAPQRYRRIQADIVARY